MVISTLQKLASVAKIPHYPFPRALIARYSASSASSTARTSSAKVSDRIVNLSAIDPDGFKQDVVGLSGQTLLKTLTNNALIDPALYRLEEIDVCSAECEFHIAQEWLDKMSPPPYDEQYALGRNSRN